MSSEQQASQTPADERDEWQTPPYLRRWALELWAPEVDLAATRENRVCHRYLSLQERVDSLAMRWGDLAGRPRTGWLNPPYSDPKPWICKAIEEALASPFTTVMLLPSPRGDQRDILYSKASELVFIVGRVAFIRPDGREAPANRGGNVIAIYRGRNLGSPRVWWVQRDSLRARWGAEGDPGREPGRPR